jgi:hypothetical protein
LLDTSKDQRIEELTQRLEELEKQLRAGYYLADPRAWVFMKRAGSVGSVPGSVKSKLKKLYTQMYNGELRCSVCQRTAFLDGGPGKPEVPITAAHIIPSFQDKRLLAPFGKENGYSGEVDVFSERNFLYLCGTHGSIDQHGNPTCHSLFDDYSLIILYHPLICSYRFWCIDATSPLYNADVPNGKEVSLHVNHKPYKRLLAWRMIASKQMLAENFSHLGVDFPSFFETLARLSEESKSKSGAITESSAGSEISSAPLATASEEGAYKYASVSFSASKPHEKTVKNVSDYPLKSMSKETKASPSISMLKGSPLEPGEESSRKVSPPMSMASTSKRGSPTIAAPPVPFNRRPGSTLAHTLYHAAKRDTYGCLESELNLRLVVIVRNLHRETTVKELSDHVTRTTGFSFSNLRLNSDQTAVIVYSTSQVARDAVKKLHRSVLKLKSLSVSLFV